MADIKKIKLGDTTYDLRDSRVITLTDSGSKTAGTWVAGTGSPTQNITSYSDGQLFLYKIAVAGSSTTTLNIDGLGAKTIYRSGTSKLTTHYGVGQYLLLAYNSTNDCFRVVNDYDANTTYSSKTAASGGTDVSLVTTGEKYNWNAAKTHADSAHAPSDAEKNVQSDWNVTDTSSDAFIKNKPTIPTVNNGKLTLNVGGAAVSGNDAFTANDATNTTYNVPSATASAYGVVKVSSVNSSAVTVNSESTTAGRYYPVELNSDGKAIVNVPWTDTNTQDGNDNQKVKTGSVTFGANDVVEFVAGDNVTVTGDATNKKITIAATDTNTWRPVGTGATDAAAGNHTHNNYLGKTTYEWNKEFAAGENGAISLGRYNMYDSHLTFDITSTTTQSLSGKLVIATQNGNLCQARVFGDATGTLVSKLIIYQSPISGSRSWIEVFCNFDGWSKNKVNIYAVALNSATVEKQMTSVTISNGVPATANVTSGDTKWSGAIINDLATTFAGKGTQTGASGTGTTGAATGNTANSSALTSGTATGNTANSAALTTGAAGTGNTGAASTSTTSKSGTGKTGASGTGNTSVPSATTTVNNYTMSFSGGVLTITSGTATVASSTHTHTGPSHTHTGPEHTHTMAHTHTGPEHTHSVPAHAHGLNNHTHTVPAHAHGLNSHTHTGPSHTHEQK